MEGKKGFEVSNSFQEIAKKLQEDLGGLQ